MKRERVRSWFTTIVSIGAGALWRLTADFNHPWLAALYFIGLPVGFVVVWLVLFAALWPRGDV